MRGTAAGSTGAAQTQGTAAGRTGAARTQGTAAGRTGAARTHRIIFGKLSACRSWKSAIWPDLTQRRTSTRSLRISFRRLAAPLGSAVFRDCNQAAASGSSSSVCGIAGWHFHIESWTEIPSAGRQEDAGRVILWYTLCSRSQSGIRRTSNCPARVREQDEVPQRREGRGKLSGTRAGQEAELCRADGEK